MSCFTFAYAFVILIASWIISHACLMPKPIPGIPFNFFAQYLPWGDLITLGLHYFRTGEVFRWLSLQSLHHESSLIQLFLPSFSTVRPTLVLAELNAIEDIVTRRIGEIDRADLMHTWFGLVVPKATIGLKSSSPIFRDQRRLWNVVVSPKFLDDVAAPCFVRAATQVADVWQKKAELLDLSRAFDAQEDVKLATLEGMWQMLVGSKLGLLAASMETLHKPRPIKYLGDEMAVFVRPQMPEFYGVLGTLLMCLDWVMLGFSSRLYTWVFSYSGILGRAMQKKDTILDECIIASRRRVAAGAAGRTCALSEAIYKDLRLTSVSKAEREADSNAALRDELLELLITGHETTASSICWALKYLTDNPEVQGRLRNSLIGAFGCAKRTILPSARDLTSVSVPYLEAVVAETLRLSNTGPVSFRQTLVPCEVLGHQVPAGTPIVLVTAGPSHSSPYMPSTFRDGDEKACRATYPRERVYLPRSSHDSHDTPFHDHNVFAPERWLLSGKFDANSVRMLPFSAGSRGCFGKKIALLELRIVIAVLVLRFEFPRLPEHLSGYEAQDGLTSRPQKCRVSPRAWR
ncbi:hypothetical protein HBI81_017870 [Parastagonospora nodorum]|nr:hypothetical protein HBI01_197360 [Parastagonospora nodorum]KAH4317966.1 hypothetical protein HBI02_017600 [Parastagonospora nodorum]KAH4326937.1 hypothetical protein HBI00_134090 [Parastagonospora nodorum]KAH4393297.1 hypothetical protein HBH94_009970 [Parastagonospora nodorum]KAH4476961.1 hypothetical protein HBH90_002710 [Parastagonospora nodorum]